MATRKKSQKRNSGLLNGPSRKQVDPTQAFNVEQNLSEQVKYVELTDFPGTRTVYTVPTGFNSRILSAYISSQGSSSEMQIIIRPAGGGAITKTYFHSTNDVYVVSNNHQYNSAPLMYSGEAILVIFSGGGQFSVAFTILETKI